MNPIRVAVVGAGHLGKIHTRILSSLADFQLVGVVDPVETQRHSVAAEFHTTPFASVAEIDDLVDAVVVAAPTSHHRRVAGDLLRRGKHVFVEKPITNTAREASELVSLASERRLTLQVGHVERFNPAFRAALDELREPKFITAVRRGGYTGRSMDIGVVMDLMIHDLDLVLSITQSAVRSVEALGVSLFGEHEDIANARIHFENGCVATLDACRASPTAARAMQVWTPRGFVSLDFAQRTASMMRPSEELAAGEIDTNRFTPAEKQTFREQLFTTHLPTETFPVEPADAITAELRDFAESITTGKVPEVSGAAGRDAVTVAEIILERIAAHRWNGSMSGPVGPRFVDAPTHPAVLSGPHWNRKGHWGNDLREAG